MTDSPLSRRQFLGATVATAAVVGLPASAAEAKPSPFAPEPTPPAGVCQRLGSARFRELTADYQFSPDSKWLAQFDGQHFIGYEVATGRRAKWTIPESDPARRGDGWQLTNDAVFVRFGDDVPEGRAPSLYDRESGRPRDWPKFPKIWFALLTPDATGLIRYDEDWLRRVDLRTEKEVWRRKWKSDASVRTAKVVLTERWIVGVGVKRLHLFDPLTGEDGPKLEEAVPKDALPHNHFTLVGVSADGKQLCGRFTADVPGGAVVWDLTTGKVSCRVTLPKSASSVAFSADGRHLLSTDSEFRLVGYDVRTGKITRRLAAENVGSLLLSPDGGVLTVLRSDPLNPDADPDRVPSWGVVRLLNPATGEPLPQSPDPSAELTAVRFADKHTVVAEMPVDSFHTSHVVWDTRGGRGRATKPPATETQLSGLGGFVPSAFGQLSPDGTRYAVMSDRLRVTDAFTRRRLHAFDLTRVSTREVCFWLGRGVIAVPGHNTLHLIDLAARTRRELPLSVSTLCTGTRVFGASVDNGKSASTPDGRTLVLLEGDPVSQVPGGVTWVDVKAGTFTTTRSGDGEQFSRLSVAADGQRVAVTSVPENAPGRREAIVVTVVDRGGGRRQFGQPTASGVREHRTELSPCGRTAFLAHRKAGEGEDAPPVPVVQFWEVLSGEKRAEFVTPFAADGLGVSPCGRRVATSHSDAPIYLWDVFGETSDPKAKPDATTWAALDGTTEKAFTAIRRLVQHPTAAVELLATKLSPAEQPKVEWVKARIDRLGSTDFRTRHTAELELSAVADRIVEPLRKAITAGADSPEADERLTRLLENAEGMPRSAWRAVRAVEALEYCEGKAAVELLKKLAGGVDTAVLTKEAKAAVRRKG